MDITVSSPGSPGTSFTDNVKAQIVLLYDELSSHDDFSSLSDFKNHLGTCGLNASYIRNILPFLQYCGIVKYENVSPFVNENFFTNIGKAYVDVLKSIQIAKAEPDCEEKTDILNSLEKIQEIIYFQCLVIMMKTQECNYSKDFYDVLCFMKEFESIDSTEYLLIQYEREQSEADMLKRLGAYIGQYRDGTISVNVKTKTKNADDGKAKSVNSFPYVSGNFSKAGVVQKYENRFYLNKERISEIECALREVDIVCQNSAK